MRNDKQIVKIFTENDCFKKNQEISLTKKEAEKLLLNILEALHIPNFLSSYPDEVYNHYIIDMLSLRIWNSAPYELRQHLNQQKRTPFSLKNKKNGKMIKARILGQEGSYPNVELKKDNNIYSFRNGIPLLITDDTQTNDAYSEVTFLNEAELKFSASIILSPHEPFCNFYYDNYYMTRINKKAFIGFNKSQIVSLSFELLNIGIIKDERPKMFSIQNIDPKNYHFSKFEKNINDFKKIFNNIDTNDQLIMRTLFYLVKSKMLWANLCFGEDAISNVLFSIEGALLLLQKKEGHSDKRINIELLSKIFSNRFDHGEYLFDFIREGYEKRISIVHASPQNGVEWIPSLTADDFYEYIDVLKMLLTYILINKINNDV